MIRCFNFKRQTVTAGLVASLLLAAFALSGCDQIDQFTTPGAPSAIKMGLVLELPSQITTQYGAQLAIAQINQEGGVLGFPLELVVKSNDDDPARSAQVAEELITQDNVAALIGPNFSRNAIEVGKVAQRLETPMVATTATNPMVTAAGNFVFLAAFSDNFQGEVMARFAREELNAQTAALLAQAEELYSTGLSDIFEANFTALGGTIVAREFYAGGDTDFTAPLDGNRGPGARCHLHARFCPRSATGDPTGANDSAAQCLRDYGDVSGGGWVGRFGTPIYRGCHVERQLFQQPVRARDARRNGA